MSTPVVLEEFLRSEDGNFTLRLCDWLKHVTAEKLSINVKFQPHGSNWQRLNDEPLTLGRQIEGVPNFVDMLDELIREKMGPNPFGTIRIQGYEPRKSAHPSLDVTRTLIPPEAAGMNEPNTALLRSTIADRDRRNAQLENQLSQVTNALALLSGNLGNALQNAATIRTASNASNELSGLGPLVSLVALVILYPQIKDLLGIPKDAPLSDVIRAFRGMINGTADAPSSARPATSTTQRPGFAHPVPKEPPEVGAAAVGLLLPLDAPGRDLFFATPPPGLPAVTPDAPAALTGDQLVEALLSEVENDPRVGLRLVEKVKGDPGLLSQIRTLLGES